MVGIATKYNPKITTKMHEYEVSSGIQCGNEWKQSITTPNIYNLNKHYFIVSLH